MRLRFSTAGNTGKLSRNNWLKSERGEDRDSDSDRDGDGDGDGDASPVVGMRIS